MGCQASPNRNEADFLNRPAQDCGRCAIFPDDTGNESVSWLDFGGAATQACHLVLSGSAEPAEGLACEATERGRRLGAFGRVSTCANFAA
jgi:hypothetical protein